jgi:hypothetical protein
VLWRGQLSRRRTNVGATRLCQPADRRGGTARGDRRDSSARGEAALGQGHEAHEAVDPNDTASVSIKTAKGAKCSIDVEYASGSSTAKGLGTKKANSKGAITWKWKVGGRTTPGEWPISIYCTKGDRSGDASTSFTVR